MRRIINRLIVVTVTTASLVLAAVAVARVADNSDRRLSATDAAAVHLVSVRSHASTTSASPVQVAQQLAMPWLAGHKWPARR